MSVGKWAFKDKGSLRGHNGIKSVANSLKTNDFKRILIGIDRPNSRDPDAISDYVLSKLKKNEKELITTKVFNEIEEFLLFKLNEENK